MNKNSIYHSDVTNTCPICTREKYKDHSAANSGTVQNFWEINLKYYKCRIQIFIKPKLVVI